ncbi:MAG: hypothetical protein QNJ12_15735, partial [Ilumatobacter sp.]|uniref:hypothetical protein n=1 Tax=Ilumatobacter sp. TaxID=1967498 RepID=UPI00260AEEC1
ATFALLRAESNVPLARRGDEGSAGGLAVRTLEEAGTTPAVRPTPEQGNVGGRGTRDEMCQGAQPMGGATQSRD